MQNSRDNLEALTKLDSRFRGNDMSGRDAFVSRIAQRVLLGTLRIVQIIPDCYMSMEEGQWPTICC